MENRRQKSNLIAPIYTRFDFQVLNNPPQTPPQNPQPNKQTNKKKYHEIDVDYKISKIVGTPPPPTLKSYYVWPNDISSYRIPKKKKKVLI